MYIVTCQSDFVNFFKVPTLDYTGFYDGGSALFNIDTRIIGFKAFLGLSSTGLYTIIRDLKLIVDTSDCELATWDTVSVDPLRYLYLS